MPIPRPWHLFFLGFSFFGSQILLAPTLATAFGGRTLVLLLAPPFLAAALALVAVALLPGRLMNRLSERATVAACAAGLAAALALVARILGSAPQADSWRSPSLDLGHEGALGLALGAISLPYIAYSLALIRALDAGGGARSLAFALFLELAGGACGTVAIGAALDAGSWSFAASLLFTSFGAGFWFAPGGRPRRPMQSWSSALIGAGLVLLAIFAGAFEPESDPRWSARGAVPDARKREVRETARAWNTYSKVQVLDIAAGADGPGKRVISIGDGLGTADLFHDARPPVTVALTAPLKPRRVLVLFAGAGAELFAFDRAIEGEKSLTGVEISPALLRLAGEAPGFGLPELLAKPGIRMANEDARVFLERTQERYDLILYSWSGSTSAYYAGAMIHTPRFAFTHEAFRRAIGLLAPRGTLAVVGASKISVLRGLRESPEPGGATRDGVLLLERQNRPGWNEAWDSHLLLVRPDGWPRVELDAVSSAGASYGYRVVIDPERVEPGYERVAALITEPDAAKALAAINESTGLHFSLLTDDRPFNSGLRSRVDRPLWDLRRIELPQYAALVLAIIFGCVSLFQFPRHRDGRSPLFSGLNAAAFLGLGLSGMLLQLLAIYRFMFLIGDPTWAMMASVGGGLFSAALSAIAVRRQAWPGRPGLVVVLAAGAWIGFHLLTSRDLLQYPALARIAAPVAAYLVASFLTSLAFPFLLERMRSGGRRIARWYAFDALAGALALGIGPLIAEQRGFTALLWIGLGAFIAAMALARLASAGGSQLAKASTSTSMESSPSH